jgi:hypothetical protein
LEKEVIEMEPVRELRFTIPKSFLEVFAQEPRFVLKPFPGLWPVDIRLLRSGLLEKLVADEEFNANFEIMIVPRG